MNTFYYGRYAEVLVKAALNLKEGDILIINAAPWDYEFVRIVEAEAYRKGAKYVRCDFEDPSEPNCRAMYSREEYLEYIPKWKTDYMSAYVNQKASILNLVPPTFEGGGDAAPKRRAILQRMEIAERKPYNKARKENGTVWVKAAVPSREWAGTVYPDCPKEEAYEKLWKNIIQIVRLDQADPVQAWEAHKEGLREKKRFLDGLNIKALHFKGPGTDLKVELAPGSVWTGGYDTSGRSGREYIPNIPTEELFAVPHKYRVNGTVSSTLPLNYNGTLIEGIKLTIADGKVTEADAEKGKEALQDIISTDSGSGYFGEISLVPVSSPIYRSGNIYYTTLLDENAVCHMAFGKALIGGIEGANELSEEELDAHGLNNSAIHVDFMIGSDKIEVSAIDQEDRVIKLMENGEWVQ